jgi:hypothetical protein
MFSTELAKVFRLLSLCQSVYVFGTVVFCCDRCGSGVPFGTNIEVRCSYFKRKHFKNELSNRRSTALILL